MVTEANKARREWIAIWVAIAAVLISAVSLYLSLKQIRVSERQHLEILRQNQEQFNISRELEELHRRQDVQQEATKEFFRKAILTVREGSFVPNGNNSPVLIPLFNEGEEEALIQRIAFTPTQRFTTPKRRSSIGAGKSFNVTFTADHYDADLKAFVLALRNPAPAPGKEWTSFFVSMAEPDWVGITYRGTITVYYDGDKQLAIDNVEIDVSKTRPSDMRYPQEIEP